MCHLLLSKWQVRRVEVYRLERRKDQLAYSGIVRIRAKETNRNPQFLKDLHRLDASVVASVVKKPDVMLPLVWLLTVKLSGQVVYKWLNRV